MDTNCEQEMTPQDKLRLDNLFEAFSLVAEGTYVYLCDLHYDISRWSQNAVDYFGLPAPYMKNAGAIWEDYIHEEDRQSYHRSIEAIFTGKDRGHDMQYRAKTPDGNYVVCTCRGKIVNDCGDKPRFFIGSINNHGLQSHIDSTTGLRNLYGFFEDLRTAIKKNRTCNAVMFGFSKFSDINDMFGYNFGNRVIQKLARKVHENLGNSGVLYRLDGPKYCVITHSLPIEEIAERYEKMRQELKSGFEVDGQHLNPVLAAGILTLDNYEITDQTVYSCLHYAFNESKYHNHGQPYIFHNSLSDDNSRYLRKINTVRDSITENCKGFFLCYQPLIHASTETLKGAEALIRWQNEEYGTVPPNDFIPVLENDNMFPELGQWILRQGLMDAKKIIEHHPGFIVNINLSYAQLEKDDFVEMVLGVLSETGVPPENLCLEITERCRLLDKNKLRRIVDELHAHGVKFALDDFGTGFSSLNVLKDLPFDNIKIDREFVRNIEHNQKELDLVKSISNLASVYGADLCVEGIETANMRDKLQDCGVSTFQGYFYSKPLPFQDFADKYQTGADGA